MQTRDCIPNNTHATPPITIFIAIKYLILVKRCKIHSDSDKKERPKWYLAIPGACLIVIHPASTSEKSRVDGFLHFFQYCAALFVKFASVC